MRPITRCVRRGPVEEGLAPFRIPRLRPELVAGSAIYASARGRLLESLDGGQSFTVRARFAGGPRLGPWTARPQAVHLMPDGSALVRMGERILFGGRQDRRLRPVHTLPRGARPGPFVESFTGGVYLAEGGPRWPRILHSRDGQTWRVARDLPTAETRELLELCSDPWRGGLWLRTGDAAGEPSLWWSDDDLTSLTRIARGPDCPRTGLLMPAQAGLVHSPRDDGPYRLELYDPETGEAQELVRLAGPGRAAICTRGLYLVSTSAAVDAAVALHGSRDGLVWFELTRLPGTGGVLELVPHCGDTPWILARASGVPGARGAGLTWRAALLRGLLPRVAQGDPHAGGRAA